MPSPCQSMSSFTEASSSSATPTAIHPSTTFNNSEQLSTDNHSGVIQLHLPHEHKFEDDMSRDNQSIMSDAKVRELESRLSVSNRVAESTKQRLLQSEQERHSNSNQVKELQFELIQAREQLKAKDETITMYAAQYNQRSQWVDEIKAQMSNVHSQLAENYKCTLEQHREELKRTEEEKRSLLQRIQLAELKYGKLEKEAEAMQKRAFCAEGAIQIAEAKLKSSVSQFEFKLEEHQKMNHFLESKVTQIENRGADKEVMYKEREKKLETELLEWRRKSENLEEKLGQIVTKNTTRIEELQGKLKVAFDESGKLRISLTQAERARDDLATISHHNENEITRLRFSIQEKEKVSRSEREERGRNAQRMEDLHERLLEAEGRLHASKQMNDFYKAKLTAFEEQKAVKIPLVAKNAVLKKKLEEKERDLNDANEQCGAQAAETEALEEEIRIMKKSHESAVESLKATVSALKTKETSLRHEVVHLHIRLGPSEKENHTLRNTIFDLESQLSASLEETNSVRCKLDEFEERKIITEMETKEQLMEYERRMKEMWSKADLLEFQLAESEADANGKIAELDSQLQKSLLQIASLENDIVYLNDQKVLADATCARHVHDLENQLKQTGNEVAALRDDALIAATDAAEEHHGLKRTIAELQSRYGDCHSELETTKSHLKQTEAHLSCLRSDTSGKIEGLQHALSSSKDTICDLKGSLANAEFKTRGLQAQVDELQSRLKDSARVAETLTDQLTEIRKTAQEQIMRLKSNLQDANEKFTETRYLLDAANEESATKTRQISDFESQLPLINRKVFYLEAEVNHAKDEVFLFQNKLKIQTDEFQSKLTIERERNDSLKAEAILKSDRANELESAMETIQSSLDEKASHLDAANRKVEDHEMKIDELISGIAEMKFKLSGSERVIDTLRAKLARAQCKGESEKTKAHQRHLATLISDYEKEIANLREKIFTLDEDKWRNIEHVRLLEAHFL